MDGNDYRPYIDAARTVPEFTLRAILLGIVLGVVFGAANAYLGLKVGMTVTASIPVSVISMGILRGLMKGGTVLENNMVQTIGSAGESIAAGVIFTIPAILMMGMSPTLATIFSVAALGGVLGVLLMIPLRRYLMVREHGALPFPEGTGCAEVLVAGEEGGSKIKTVFAALGVGALYKALMDPHVCGLWSENPSLRLPFLKRGEVGIDSYPSLLGVGFIVGPRIASLMLAGGALAWLGLIPLIATVGEHLATPLYPSSIPISEMSASQIWTRYIRYIGAGAVAFGGIVSLIRAVPSLLGSFRESLRGFSLKVDASAPRTHRDLPGAVIIGGALLVALLLWLDPAIEVNLLGAALMVIFTFFFASVASRLVGLVGGSSLPVSGMTIAALLGTALIFSALGWTTPEGKVAALIVGAVVCVGISAAGDMSQDLKTGFLVGATPYRQQYGEFIGVLSAAPFIGIVVLLLHSAFTIGSEALPAPQATLMRLVVDGVMDRNLPWDFVLAGMAIAAVIELLRLPSLPFAVGLYLPFALSVPIVLGGILRGLAEKRFSGARLKEARENGVLFGSGLVAGEATLGILVAVMVYGKDKFPFMAGLKTPFLPELPLPGLMSILALGAVGWLLWREVNRKPGG
ncbi:MAG: oligopeptide transporter, OPT family [Calditrichaeota bacterium]|nr:oligopeptide transporter, OPT family [Calditrichota bacterium]